LLSLAVGLQPAAQGDIPTTVNSYMREERELYAIFKVSGHGVSPFGETLPLLCFPKRDPKERSHNAERSVYGSHSPKQTKLTKSIGLYQINR
jgi:hypothetical protein